MRELIDRQALDNAFTSLRFNSDGELAHWGDRKDWCLHGSEIEKLIADAPTINAAPRWVRCEEKPKDRQECFVAYKGPLGFIYESAIFYDDLNSGLDEDIFEDGTSGFVLGGEVGYALTSMDYWMPIEPPQEVQDGQ